MNDKNSFRDQLLAVEPPAADLHHKLEQEIHDMMTRKLKLPARIFISVVGVFALGSAALCGYLAVTEATLPVLARVGLGVGVLFGLAWAAFSFKVVRSGEMNLLTDQRLAAQMVWVFTVLMVTFFLILGMSTEDRLLGVLVILQSLVFLIGAAVYFLGYLIQSATLSLKEHLLRTELQITQLLEKK
jgi:hypothetical protein